MLEPTFRSIRIRPEISDDSVYQSWEAAFVWVDNTKMTLHANKGTSEFCDVTGYSRQDDYQKIKMLERKIN